MKVSTETENKGKKVGIITLSNSTNYGGVLQAVALSRTVKKLGMEPVNITFQKIPSPWNSVRLYVQRRVRLYGCKGIKTKIRICGGMAKTLLSNVHYGAVKQKQENFKAFLAKYLKETPWYPTTELLKEHCSEYDAYITGSDQVWNSAFSYNQMIGAYFLDFVPKGAPCYSYAASAGGKKSDEYVREIIQRTEHFSGITVREKSLEEHMKKLGCDRVQTVVDPTLLVSREEWASMAQKPRRQVPEHYILVYYLEKDVQNDPVIQKISREKNLPVVDIMPNYCKTQYPHVVDDTAGPAEFLHYVKNADYVITNSFHMVVFSLIFGKKFVALRREGQESRIHDLLQLVKGEQRYIESEKEWHVIDSEVPDLNRYIQCDRENSLEYLRRIGGAE